ncbi:tyrosine-type recombinase/integrase [Anaeromassilibacillus senegalensis]|uniref:tyrosine-type recombinase/integrase n=1 Tax=Anaeromassilibacillus senegalensis TaxID=1673717 RepID=UPI000682AD88|nr:site-specific integrase [Anaeromassilibacillus senegalensis]
MKRQKNGTGAFYKRDNGTIQYRVSAGVGPDGKSIRKSFYGRSEKECMEKYRQWVKSGQNAPVERVKTIGEWCDKWLELYKKDSISYGTYRNYKMYIEKHIKPAIGHLKFSQIRQAHIAALFKKESNLSDSARHHLYVALNGIFETAVKNHFCTENPVMSPTNKRTIEETVTVKIFSLDEIHFILASDHPNAIYAQLLLYTGLRMGELIALKWSDIDLKEQIITVRNSIARAEHGGFEEKTTKSGKVRHIGMTGPLYQLLTTLPKRGLYVLTDKDSGFLSPHQFERRYKKFFTECQIPFLSPHKCRHTYATYLVKGGAELRAVQTLLGHSNSQVTEIYTHIDTDDIRNNVSKLAY